MKNPQGLSLRGIRDGSMDKYKRLFSNTLIFAIGTFGSKLLAFFLMPLYTNVLTDAQYGTSDLLQQSANLLVPLVTFGITDAVIRFGLDRKVRNSEVLTTGILTMLAGFCLLFLCFPLLELIPGLDGYTHILLIFVITSSTRQLFQQFVRAKGQVKLYAVDGILSTALTLLFTILFLVGFHWGVEGYLAAIICADGCSCLFLMFNGQILGYFHPSYLRKKRTMKDMLRYSIPMIPNTVFWWVTTVSSRYIITAIMGEGANGLYAAAYKWPSAIILISTIFMNAWQMSAISEEKGRAQFFTHVFHGLSSLVFIVGSFLILFSKVITRIMVADSYYESWQYIPLLSVATVYSCMVTFLGTVYVVNKKSTLSLATTAAGAIVNVVLSFFLISYFGINGAAFAMFASYFVVFLLRAHDTKRFIHMRIGGFRITVNTLLLLAQAFVMIYEIPYWIAVEILLTAAMVLLNLSGLLAGVKKILPSRKKTSA